MARPRKSVSESTASIYRAADGLWHAKVVMATRPDGTADRRHIRRKSKSDLVKAVRLLENSREDGTYDWTQDDPTVSEWIEHWLNAILPMSARRKTLATYRSQMDHHLLPTLGGYQLSDLRPEHFEGLYVSLARHGRSVHTIRAVHRVVRSALNEAVRRRLADETRARRRSRISGSASCPRGRVPGRQSCSNHGPLGGAYGLPPRWAWRVRSATSLGV